MNEQDKYLPYLKEIQRKIIILCFTTLGFSLIGFFYYQKIIGFILGLFKFDGITMVLTSPYQFFDLAINTGIATGVIVAFPLLIYFLISFLRPALDKTEFKHLLSMVPAAFVLFVIGFGFGIYVFYWFETKCK